MKTMMGSMLCLCLCSTLIAALFSPLPALADSAVIVRSMKIDTSGLDLTRPQDLRELQRRIRRAARRVCGPEPYLVTPDRPDYLGYETCYQRALKTAQANADALVREARTRHERLAKPGTPGEGQAGARTDR